MIYIGIDPGQNGGIAVITGAYTHAWPMPVFPKDERKERGGAIDWPAVSDILEDWKDDSYCMLEKVWGMPGQGATSTFSFGGAYHGVLAILQAREIEYDLVVPRNWKNAIMGERYSHDKDGAVLYAGDHHPSVNLILPRCRVPHDGMADAVCIAAYAKSEHEKL